MQIKCGLVADVSAKGDRQMSWKVGDIAICITPDSEMEGCEVEIISGLKKHMSMDVGGIAREVLQHYVDPGIPPRKGCIGWGAAPQNLIPLPPANEVTTWEECIFKPRELVT